MSASPLSFLRAGPPPPTVALLPDALFFTRAVPITTGATAAEAAAQIELALEAVSPFPLAQLYYGWFWQLKNLPDAPESRYLYAVLAGHDFQEGLKNYRDLVYMGGTLERWDGDMVAFEDMIGTREAAFAERLPRADALLAKMTFAEKIGQLNQLFFFQFQSVEAFTDGIRKGEIGSLLFVTDPALINRLQKVAVTESRLKIPLIFGFDVIHGFHTIFPVPIGMAASWDPQMVEGAQSIAASEARAVAGTPKKSITGIAQ